MSNDNRENKVQNMNYLFGEDEIDAIIESEISRERVAQPGNGKKRVYPNGNPEMTEAGGAVRRREPSAEEGVRRQRPRPQNAPSQARRSQPGARRVSGSASDPSQRRRAQSPSRANAPEGRGARAEYARRSNARSSVNRKGSVRTGRKRRKSGFKKFLLIYSAILLVILIAGMIIFGSFLKSLEKNQPSRIASEIAENFTESRVTGYLEKHKDELNSFGDPAPLISECAESLSGKGQASYIENKDFRADEPSYNITVDGKTVCKATLGKNGKAGFGLDKWKIKSLDIADYLETGAYEIEVPEGTVITINGEEVGDRFRISDAQIPETLRNASQYVNIPKFVTYKVAGVAQDPQISAKDRSGNELSITAAGNKYVAGASTDTEFTDSVYPLVDKALDAWGRHFINMGGNLSAYMLEGSEWYGFIFGSDEMDPIMTSFYEYESIDNYEFTEKTISNFIRYTDDCFTVDVKYKMRIDFNDNRMSDDNQQLDATWTFITQNDGKDWYIIECTYK